jgi:uridine monophosphate synthetase
MNCPQSLSHKDKIASRLIAANLVKYAKPDQYFALKSGKKSDIYVDLRPLGAHPELCNLIAHNMIPMVTDMINNKGYIAGLPLGGIPMAAWIANKTKMKFLLIRKESKEHGTKKIVEADILNEISVLLIDDVITTGSTVRETIEKFREQSLPIKVVGVLCIVNRCDDSPNVVPGTNVPLRSLVTLEDIKNYQSLSKQNIRVPFVQRISKNQAQQTGLLFEIMDQKKTNVCWSADVTDGAQLLEIFNQIAPHIALIKIHFDAIPGLTTSHINQMFEIAYDNNVMVMGDRKFADIGATVRKQVECHPTSNASNASNQNLDRNTQLHCCTVHTIAGESGVKALQERSIDSVLIAEMSNKGSISDDEIFSSYYAEATASLAKRFSATVMGIVCQSRINCDAGDNFVYMTPGVHLEQKTDGGDQRYRDCYQAIAVQNNDVVIVGRGIHGAENPLIAVKQYQEQAWNALSSK